MSELSRVKSCEQLINLQQSCQSSFVVEMSLIPREVRTMTCCYRGNNEQHVGFHDFKPPADLYRTRMMEGRWRGAWGITHTTEDRQDWDRTECDRLKHLSLKLTSPDLNWNNTSNLFITWKHWVKYYEQNTCWGSDSRNLLSNQHQASLT